jgi:hypothetical protein
VAEHSRRDGRNGRFGAEGFLTDGDASLPFWADKGALRIARLFSLKQIPIGGSDTGLSARDYLVRRRLERCSCDAWLHRRHPK